MPFSVKRRHLYSAQRSDEEAEMFDAAAFVSTAAVGETNAAASILTDTVTAICLLKKMTKRE